MPLWGWGVIILLGPLSTSEMLPNLLSPRTLTPFWNGNDGFWPLPTSFLEFTYHMVSKIYFQHLGDIQNGSDMFQCRSDSDCCGSSACVRVRVTDMVVGQCSSYSSHLNAKFPPQRGLENGNCWFCINNIWQTPTISSHPLLETQNL